MTRFAILVASLATTAATLTGCSTQPAAELIAANTLPASHPVSGLRVIPLTVITDKGSHTFRVEVAASAAEQARGLMFRTELGPNEGMIFPRNPPDVASFWMKNTPLPLDIIFIGTDRRIINIAAQTVPYSLASVTATGMAGAVFEIPGGRAAELGIGPGARVNW